MNQKAWCQFLWESGIFQTGEFTLKSGKASPYFMNFGKADEGKTLAQLGDFLAQAIHHWKLEPDLLFGPAYKGLPLALATSMAYFQRFAISLPWGSFRKESKDHGDAGLALGRAPWPGCKILMLDDVLTTSQTKFEAMQQIRESLSPQALAPQFLGVVVGVDRQERDREGQPYAESFTAKSGVPVFAMTSMEALLENLAGNQLQGETLAQCRQAFLQR